MAIFASYAGQLESRQPKVSVVGDTTARNNLLAAVGDMAYVADAGAGSWGMHVWTGAGWVQISTGQESRNHTLTATVDGSATTALDANGESLAHGSIDLYTIKMTAVDQQDNICTREIRGVISGTDIVRIDDIVRSDFSADVALSSDGSTLTAVCSDPGRPATYTLHVTLSRVKD